MKKKGFTLIELLAVIVILAVVVAIIIPIVANSIANTRNEVYIKNKKLMVQAAQNYISTHFSTVPKKVGDAIELSLSDLYSKGFIEKINNSFDSDKYCNGYVIIIKLSSKKYEYIPHLNCLYDAGNSVDDKLIMHGAFDDFQEPTENLVQLESFLTDLSYGQSVVNVQNSTPVKYTRLGENTYKIDIIEDHASQTQTKLSNNITWYRDIPTTISAEILDYYLVPESTVPFALSRVGYGSVDFNSIGYHSKTYYSWSDHIQSSTALGWRTGWTINSFVKAGSYLTFKNFQAERKLYATPFTITTREGIIKDYSGNGNTSTLQLETTPQWINNSKVGLGAYKFNDTNSVIQTDYNVTLINSQTYSAWINPIGNDSLDGIVSLHNHSNTSNLGLNLINSKLSASIGYTDNTREYQNKTSISSIPYNKWTHVAMTYDFNNNKIKFYINGKLDSEHALTKNVKFTNNKITIGQWANSYLDNYVFNGSIDDVKIYNRALSAEEIKLQYDVAK